jgi:hypothetical protein
VLQHLGHEIHTYRVSVGAKAHKIPKRRLFLKKLKARRYYTRSPAKEEARLKAKENQLTPLRPPGQRYFKQAGSLRSREPDRVEI